MQIFITLLHILLIIYTCYAVGLKICTNAYFDQINQEYNKILVEQYNSKTLDMCI